MKDPDDGCASDETRRQVTENLVAVDQEEQDGREEEELHVSRYVPIVNETHLTSVYVVGYMQQVAPPILTATLVSLVSYFHP